jgi:hypothetical protein
VQGENLPDNRPLLTRVDELLESRLIRLAFVALVITSLLPLGSLEGALRPVFLVVFGAELFARLALWRRGTRVTTTSGVLFAVADGLAFVSFLPLEGFFDAGTVHFLALLRLTRLFVLVRFARDLARDIYAILTRREQLQTLGLVSAAVVVLTIVSAVILSQLAVPVGDDGAPLDFTDRLWWSFRQLESADNLVQSLHGHPVLTALSLALTLTGVFLISFIIGVGANVVDQVVRAERRRALGYAGHTVVVGNVHDGEDLVREFVRMYAKNRQIPAPERLLTWLRYMRPSGPRTFPRVALLSTQDEPPDYLVEPIMRWVVYRQGDESEPESLHRVAVNRAKRAILLSHHEFGWEADAAAIATLSALRAQNRDCHAYVEVADPAVRDLVLEVGGDNTVALDVPRFLGMFLCQHLLMPGVEALYRDLLTADGAEIYTHIFVDNADHAALGARTTALRFEDIAALAAEYGVIVLGVYLGGQPVQLNAAGVVPMAGLVRWLNPAADVDDERIVALGGRRGLVPAQTLRGIIGIAEGYLALRTFAAALVAGRSAAHVVVPPPSRQAAVDAAILPPRRGPERVALVGYSEALPALLQELARYVPGVDVQLFLSARGDERLPLSRRLASLRIGIDDDDPLPGRHGRVLALERGGRLTVCTHDGSDLAQFAAQRLTHAVDAAVFLSEPEGSDRDARTAMRVLRFVKQLEQQRVPRGEHLHLLAEFVSIDKGEHLRRHVDARRCGFADASALKLTLIAKETIKSYFMVHSAFVPGVSEIYDELLEERGQDIARLPFVRTPDVPDVVTLRDLARVLLPRQAIPIAVETTTSTWLAPAPNRPIPTTELRGVYCVIETAPPSRPAGGRAGDPSSASSSSSSSSSAQMDE